MSTTGNRYDMPGMLPLCLLIFLLSSIVPIYLSGFVCVSWCPVQFMDVHGWMDRDREPKSFFSPLSGKWKGRN